MKPAISIFREANAIAQTCPDKVRRDILRERATACRIAYDVLCIVPTRAHMQDLVGTWTRMQQAIDAISPLGDDNPNGGRLSLPAPTEELNVHVA